MNYEIDLAAKSIAWIIAPTGMVVSVWMFGARIIEVIKVRMEARADFCEARQIQVQLANRQPVLTPALDEKSASPEQKRSLWLARDRDRYRAEGFECLRVARIEMAKSVIPLTAIILCGALISAPWAPVTSPLTYLSELLRSEKPADDSLEFFADAGLRFQTRLAELNSKLADVTADRDRKVASLEKLKASIAKAAIAPEQKRELLSELDRRPNSDQTPSQTITPDGMPPTSLSTVQAPAPPITSTPAPAISPIKDRYAEIAQELKTRWPACLKELDAITAKGPAGERFSNWVAPRMIVLIRSERGEKFDTLLRELLAAFDTETNLFASSPTLVRIHQLLRQLDIILHGLSPRPTSR